MSSAGILAASIEIEDVCSGRRFRCAHGQNLLAALKAGGSALRVGCRNGGCGVCKVRILGGEIDGGRMSVAHVDERERQRGVVLACRAIPKTDLLIETTVRPVRDCHE